MRKQSNSPHRNKPAQPRDTSQSAQSGADLDPSKGANGKEQPCQPNTDSQEPNSFGSLNAQQTLNCDSGRLNNHSQPSQSPQADNDSPHDASNYEIQEGDETFACNFKGCNKVFARKIRLQAHHHMHYGTQPFKCPQRDCGKRFSEKQNLRIHMRIHNNERPFACPQMCGKSFRTKGNMRDHERRHFGEKPFMCTNCFTRYYRKNVLKAHMLRCVKDVSLSRVNSFSHEGRQNQLVAAAKSTSKPNFLIPSAGNLINHSGTKVESTTQQMQQKAHATVSQSLFSESFVQQLKTILSRQGTLPKMQASQEMPLANNAAQRVENDSDVKQKQTIQQRSQTEPKTDEQCRIAQVCYQQSQRQTLHSMQPQLQLINFCKQLTLKHNPLLPTPTPRLQQISSLSPTSHELEPRSKRVCREQNRIRSITNNQLCLQQSQDTNPRDQIPKPQPIRTISLYMLDQQTSQTQNNLMACSQGKPHLSLPSRILSVPTFDHLSNSQPAASKIINVSLQQLTNLARGFQTSEQSSYWSNTAKI